jgi:hypothetical protein
VDRERWQRAWQKEASDEIRSDGTAETLHEVRRVIDAQTDELDRLDDRAVRTVRIVVLLLGLLGSVIRFGDSSPSLNVAIQSGAALLIASILTGTLVYGKTDKFYGVRPDSFDTNPTKISNERVRSELVQEYEDQIPELRRQIRIDAAVLNLTQLLFLLGAVSLGIGLFFIGP